MAIHQIPGDFLGLFPGKPTVQMDDDLVTKDIEVDPMLIAAALRKAEGSAIKFPGLLNVPYRDRHMEGSQQSNTFAICLRGYCVGNWSPDGRFGNSKPVGGLPEGVRLWGSTNN